MNKSISSLLAPLTLLIGLAGPAMSTDAAKESSPYKHLTTYANNDIYILDSETGKQIGKVDQFQLQGGEELIFHTATSTPGRQATDYDYFVNQHPWSQPNLLVHFGTIKSPFDFRNQAESYIAAKPCTVLIWAIDKKEQYWHYKQIYIYAFPN